MYYGIPSSIEMLAYMSITLVVTCFAVAGSAGILSRILRRAVLSFMKEVKKTLHLCSFSSIHVEIKAVKLSH